MWPIGIGIFRGLAQAAVCDTVLIAYAQHVSPRTVGRRHARFVGGQRTIAPSPGLRWGVKAPL